VFYDDDTAAPTLARFAFCKREEVIAEAARRLTPLATSIPRAGGRRGGRPALGQPPLASHLGQPTTG